MKKKPPMKLTFKGIEWTFVVQTNATYCRNHDKNSEASTYPFDKEVVFNATYFSPYVVKHELLHVAVASSSTASSNLDAEQVEELCCELYGEHSNELDHMAEKILNYFLR